ncbi:hypothetical protein Tco_0390582 [Tanacetum coccineum]
MDGIERVGLSVENGVFGCSNGCGAEMVVGLGAKMRDDIEAAAMNLVAGEKLSDVYLEIAARTDNLSKRYAGQALDRLGYDKFYDQDARLLKHDYSNIREDHLDKRWEAATREVVDEIIFLTRHTTASTSCINHSPNRGTCRGLPESDDTFDQLIVAGAAGGIYAHTMGTSRGLMLSLDLIAFTFREFSNQRTTSISASELASTSTLQNELHDLATLESSECGSGANQEEENEE